MDHLTPAAHLTWQAPPGEFPALPAESALDMPTQSLRTAPVPRRRLASSPPDVAWRRCVVIGGTAALSAVAAYEMFLVLDAAGITTLGLAVLVLFVALFAWVALAFIGAIAGFVILFCRRNPALGAELPPPSSRTALLMPVYNESPARVAAGLQAMWESLDAAGARRWFDVFILSDTTNPDIWIAEEAAFFDLRARTGGADCIFYRHRPANTGRKAGNIADWVRRFGGAYPLMVVLDADSVMTAEALLQLVAAIERTPDAGLIQTLPVIVNGATLFARMQQFAGRIYGPLIAEGLAFWHGAEGNYWGHNAIIRTHAFAAQAGLPELRGRKPFGGHIASHDFVEAALLRRGGWSVHMVPGLHGSYEEGPPSLADLAARDRRWCQGNLQHAAVLPARGLHWISRLHMLMGIGSYLTAPLWLLFLVLGVSISLQAKFTIPDYFPAAHALFPRWPVVDPVRSMWVFIGTMSLLLAPKLMGFIILLRHRADLRGCGGALRAFASLLFETLLAGLIAPITMLSQSADIASVLLGRDSGWQTQRRDDGSIPPREALRRYAPHTLFGALLGGSAVMVAPSLAAWMSPVIAGLVLSVPLVLLTAAAAPADWARRLGLLQTPEDATPPLVLAAARQRLPAGVNEPSARHRLANDRALLEAHIAMLPPSRYPRLDPCNVPLLVAMAKLEAADGAADLALTPQEETALLGDRHGVQALVALTQNRMAASG